ncbi:hypothetical protein NWE57_03825 [Mycoplasmopsis cynos]|nr:hypothetical protein [Mycoplasmopsis cynos]UWV92046.1 hypothetical protein NWE57_03825 [Mycoplasmopsis cynos]
MLLQQQILIHYLKKEIWSGDSIDFQNVKQYQIPFKLNGAEYIERNGFNTIKISLNGIEGETEYAKYHWLFTKIK